MITISIMYPKQADGRFDMNYYLERHMPMSIKLLGPSMESIVVGKGISPGDPWPEASYHAITTFTCRSKEEYEQAFLPNMAELQADMPNYTDIPAIIQMSEIALSD